MINRRSFLIGATSAIALATSSRAATEDVNRPTDTLACWGPPPVVKEQKPTAAASLARGNYTGSPEWDDQDLQGVVLPMIVNSTRK